MGRISFISVVAQSRIGTSLPSRLSMMSRVAAGFDDALLIAAHLARFLAAVRRTVAQQTVQQERIDEADLFRVDANGQERIEVDAAYFDILDARLPSVRRSDVRSSRCCASAGWCRRTRSRSAAAWSTAAGTRRPPSRRSARTADRVASSRRAANARIARASCTRRADSTVRRWCSRDRPFATTCLAARTASPRRNSSRLCGLPLTNDLHNDGDAPNR